MTETFKRPNSGHSIDTPYIGHILPDTPADEPVFGFIQIAGALAQIIQQSEPRFAVGIFGGWGSGKSTLMNAIARQIDPERAIVVQFNAWRYEREPHLVLPLLDTIRESLSTWAARCPTPDKEKVESIAGRVGKVVRAFASGLSAEVGVPGAVTLTFDVEKALDTLNPQRASDDAGAPQSLYYAAFQELNAAFKEVQQTAVSRIIVFVDDLDRSLPGSALTVLESMKLFFDMPGFVFVVGLDEQVILRAVSSKFAYGNSMSEDTRRDTKLEYTQKIFQVPYTLPSVALEDLDELLQLLQRTGGLSESQRADLGTRIRKYLPYVMAEGHINPREVKRFVNAYTLQRMTRPELDPDTVLALQALDFRPDWEDVYDMLLAQPNDFVDALGQYRGGDLHAFQNLWPTLPGLPADLVSYLRSSDAAPLTASGDLERYVSSLTSARTAAPWLKEAIRDIGQLRKVVRRLPAELKFGNTAAEEAAEEMRRVLSRFNRHTYPAEASNSLRPNLRRLKQLVDQLAPPGASEPADTSPKQVEEWKAQAHQTIDALHEEVKILRRSSAFAPP
jgi:hypothetical protein